MINFKNLKENQKDFESKILNKNLILYIKELTDNYKSEDDYDFNNFLNVLFTVEDKKICKEEIIEFPDDKEILF